MLSRTSISVVGCQRGQSTVVLSRRALPAQRLHACIRRTSTAVNALREHDAPTQRLQTFAHELKTAALAMAMAAAVLTTPAAAMADLVQTVPASQVTEMAKPLPKQTIDKGKVWLVFIGGAVSLFITTVLAENNAAWFPAISRANQAMAKSRKEAQEDQQPSTEDQGYTTTAEDLPPYQLQQPATTAAAPDSASNLSEVETWELEAELQRQAKLVEEGLLSMGKKAREETAGGIAIAAEGPGSSTTPAAAQNAAVAAADVAAAGSSSNATTFSDGQDGSPTTTTTVASHGNSTSFSSSSSTANTTQPDAASAPAALTTQQHAATEESPASGSSSSSDNGIAGYTVVADPVFAAPAAAFGSLDDQDTTISAVGVHTQPASTAQGDSNGSRASSSNGGSSSSSDSSNVNATSAPSAGLTDILEAREALQQYKQQQQLQQQQEVRP